jgi:2-(1,2-epoxy-1,2-dihydrophenyl)acetyl-CoA isomerase
MAYEKLVLTKEKSGVATIRLNRPEVLNALDRDLHRELHSAIKEVRDDAEVRVVIITGTGRGFCAGRDFKETARRVAEGEQRQPGTGPPPPGLGTPWDINVDLWHVHKPVIAAVNGAAIGGGMSVALACDIIVASENATFGEFFIKRGMVASGCTQFLLPHLVGPHHAKMLLFTGDLIDAREAERIGLVNCVYPADEFEARVKELAEKIASRSTKVLSMIKRLVNDGLTQTIEEVGRAEKLIDDDILIPSFAGDIAEGVQAFVEKREPKARDA